MTDTADQPGKVTCVSCADKSICRAHFTRSTFFILLQHLLSWLLSFIVSVTIEFHFSKNSILPILRSFCPLWTKCFSVSKHFPPFHFPFFFSVDGTFCLPGARCRNDLIRSKCFFPDQNFAKVFANMMYSFCQKPPCVFKFEFLHKLKH